MTTEPREANLGLDRTSVRTIDEDGRLRIAITPISKAQVSPYYGHEIPGAEAAGWNPAGVYHLLRDPVELAKAAPTFDGVQLLEIHEPVSAEDPKKSLVVGAMGTDCVFHPPYLMNSMIVWDSNSIARIQSGQQKELSCGYRYDLDPTPGQYEGQYYDGVMRNLRGNHVALVDVGRAGSDVVVGDQAPNLTHKGGPTMAKKNNSKAKVALDALNTELKPKLAQDELNLGEVASLLDALNNAMGGGEPDMDEFDDGGDFEEDGDMEAPPEGGGEGMGGDGPNPAEAMMALLQEQNLPPEVLQQVAALCDQMQAPPKPQAPKKEGPMPQPQKPEGIGKPAMDAAIASAVEKAKAETMTKMQAIRTAEKEVAPLIGEVIAQDSAEAVYKLALAAAKIDLTDVPSGAYRAMVRMIPVPSGEPAPLAQDSASTASTFDRFPSLKNIGRAI